MWGVTNSRLHMFSGKLGSRWTRPFIVKKVFHHEVVELRTLRMKMFLK